jgi:hypothetical protein
MAAPGEAPPTGVAGSRRVGGRWVASARGPARDLADGYSYRSTSERNYARFLTYLGIPYEYETKRFEFPGVRPSKNRHYLADFWLPHAREIHEVKGWLDRDSAIKLRRMAQFYPHVPLILIDAAFFRAAERRGLCRVIPGWECRHHAPEGGGHG